MEYCTNVGEKIKSIRLKKNLSQERFGTKVGVSGKTISCYETGKVKPPLKILEKIARIYKIPFLVSDLGYRSVIREKMESINRMVNDLDFLINREYE